MVNNVSKRQLIKLMDGVSRLISTSVHLLKLQVSAIKPCTNKFVYFVGYKFIMKYRTDLALDGSSN